MSNIDTLKLYKDFIAAGKPEKQAEAEVKALDNSLVGFTTNKDLKHELLLLKHDIYTTFTLEILGLLLAIIIVPLMEGRLSFFKKKEK